MHRRSRPSHVAMLVLHDGVVVQGAVQLAEASLVDERHRTDRRGGCARIHDAEAPRIARAEQRHLLLHHLHRVGPPDVAGLESIL